MAKHLWWSVLVLIANATAFFLIEEKPIEDLSKTMLTLIPQWLKGTLYCAYVSGDGSYFAQHILGHVTAASPIPITSKQCSGDTAGIFVIEDGENVLPSVLKGSQHFKLIIILVSGSLQTVLENPSCFTSIAENVVLANASSAFHLMPSTEIKFQLLQNGKQEHNRLPNLQRRTLHVATYHCPPFSYYKTWVNHIQNGSIPYGIPDGVEMAVFLALSKRLNFTWELEDVKGTIWGLEDGNGSYTGGIMGVMERKMADIAFCGIFLDTKSIQVMDLIPWTHYCLTFLVPLHASSFRFALLRTFQPPLWCAVLVATLSMTVIFWAFSYYREKPQNLVEVLLAAIGMLCMSNFPAHNSFMGRLRILVASWCVFSFLLTNALSSGLVSHLTRPTPAEQLNTVRDLVLGDITWGQDHKQDETRLFNPEDPWHARFADRFEQEFDNRIERVRRGHYAILGGKLDGIDPYFMEGDTLNGSGLLKNLHVMRDCVIRQYAGIGLTKRSPLTESIRKAVYWLIETGLVEHWQSDLVRDHGNPEIKMLFQHERYKETQKLTWPHLEDVFLLLSIGLALSTLVFFLEFCHFKIKSSICL